MTADGSSRIASSVDFGVSVSTTRGGATNRQNWAGNDAEDEDEADDEDEDEATDESFNASRTKRCTSAIVSCGRKRPSK